MDKIPDNGVIVAEHDNPDFVGKIGQVTSEDRGGYWVRLHGEADVLYWFPKEKLAWFSK